MTGRTMAIALVVCVLALMGASAAGGYLYAGKGSAQALGLARGDTRSCTDTAAAMQRVLDQVAERLAALRADHRAFLDAANQAEAAAATENARLHAAGAATSKTIQEVARVDPDCAALTLLPLCPAIAVQLWPVAGTAARAEPAHAD